MPTLQIVPSLLSADQQKLDEEVIEIEQYIDRVQFDVMDGKFVKPTAQTADDVRKITSRIPKEIHLMVEDPLQWIDDFIEAGSTMLIFHVEIQHNITTIINHIKSKNVKVGIAVNPKTPILKILPYVDKVDMVLLMTVEPGYSGQKFIHAVIPKIQELRKLYPDLDIEVDGGINKITIKDAVQAGANIIVAASAIFCQQDRVKAIKELLKAAM